MKKINIKIVIPAYNEEKNIIAFIKRWFENPIIGSLYMLLQIGVYIQRLFYKPSLKWSVVERRAI